MGRVHDDDFAHGGRVRGVTGGERETGVGHGATSRAPKRMAVWKPSNAELFRAAGGRELACSVEMAPTFVE
jgi:hypothetical protein